MGNEARLAQCVLNLLSNDPGDNRPDRIGRQDGYYDGLSTGSQRVSDQADRIKQTRGHGQSHQGFLADTQRAAVGVFAEILHERRGELCLALSGGAPRF
jgi:hypothetical protein